MGMAVVKTHTGAKSFVSVEDEKEVRGFVEEHNIRYHAGDAGGPGGQPAELVKEVVFYKDAESAEDVLQDEEKGKDLDISDLL